ncbi:MAG: trigger factor [Clostridia bacterium]|nr:trigger factor [Clostridia bacterium]
MKYTQSVAEKSAVKLTISFTEEEWKDAISKAYVKTRGKYSVPGFRKGKAPQPVLENYYGKGLFYEEAFNYLYSQHYFTILEKEKENFTAVGEPELSVEDMTEGKGVTLTALVPVKPDVTIDAYTGLKIKKYEYNVTDAEVDAEVNKLLERHATETEVKNRASKNGDKVNIDFSGTVDGVQFAGGTAEEYDLVLGSGSFIPGFEAQVEGMKVGEKKDITVKFPDDYQAENLKGKDAVFAIKLNKIFEKQLPELTDEYVKANAGSETVKEYKDKTREKLIKQAENRSRDETENSIVDEICKHAKAEIPQAMVESEIDRMVQEFSYRLMYQGIKLEDYLKYLGQSMKEFRAQFNSQAETRVLQQLVIEKIIKTEKITASDKEIDAKVAEQAKSVEKTAEEYKKNMDPRQLDYIKNDLVISKLFEYLMANNEMYTEGAKTPAKKTSTAKSTATTAEKKPATAKSTATTTEKKPATAKTSTAKTTATKSTTTKTTAKKPAVKKED